MQETTTAVQPYTPQPMPLAIQPELSIAEIRDRKKKIHELMKELMVPEHHYGTVPGTDKPMLYKPGAEMLCMAFRLMPSFNVVQKDLADGHREYRVDCDLTNLQGAIVAKGVGSCSTMESKYRWRLGSRKCPECQEAAIRKSKEEYGGGFYCSEKHGGCNAKFAVGDKRIIEQELGKVPNPDIADQYNTCLKMAAKRAHSHAVLLATAASDIFAPEREDGDDDEDENPKQAKKTPSAKKEQPPKKEEPPKKGPPPEQTPKQKLMAECFAMKAELLKQGRTNEGLIDLLGAHSVVMGKTWGDMAEADLELVKKAFAEELKLGTPVAPAKEGK
jgi:hypothetical protein